MNLVLSNQFTWSPTWVGSFVFSAGGLHLTEARNSDLGFALAFPFTATSATISGLETFGDNQFLTPITAFPILRNQEKYHLLKHPFYQAWTAGKLSKDSLALYAEQYYQHVRSFPDNLKQLAARTNGDANLRALVNENLAEELDPAASHPMLWRHFAQSLGVSEASMEDARPLPGIAALLDTFDEVAAQGSKTQAVAAFYVYEAQVPEIATQKISGLRRFYDCLLYTSRCV